MAGGRPELCQLAVDTRPSPWRGAARAPGYASLQLLDERAGLERENDEVGLEVKVIFGARLVAGELRARRTGRVGRVLVDADDLASRSDGVQHLSGAGRKAQDPRPVVTVIRTVPSPLCTETGKAAAAK